MSLTDVFLRPSLTVEAPKVAESEGMTLEQLVNAALAEKLSVMRTESYCCERAARGDIPRAIEILKEAGAGNPTLPADEILA